MKKLAFLAILLTISLVGFTQTSNMEPVVRTMGGFLSKYYIQEKYHRVPVRHLASDSISKFRLLDFTRTTEKYENGEKKYLYKLIFMRLNDGEVLELTSYDKKMLLSALNEESHYIYTDGKKLFVAKKK